MKTFIQYGVFNIRPNEVCEQDEWFYENPLRTSPDKAEIVRVSKEFNDLRQEAIDQDPSYLSDASVTTMTCVKSQKVDYHDWEVLDE